MYFEIKWCMAYEDVFSGKPVKLIHLGLIAAVGFEKYWWKQSLTLVLFLSIASVQTGVDLKVSTHFDKIYKAISATDIQRIQCVYIRHRASDRCLQPILHVHHVVTHISLFKQLSLQQ